MSTNPITAVQVIEPEQRHTLTALTAQSVKNTMEVLKLVRTFVAGELKDKLDYGVIPGTGDKAKKTLLLPGAQKVCMFYNCYPKYIIQETALPNDHVDFRVTTELVNRSTDCIVGMGLGSCSTMESKYRWRQAARKCPSCGKEAIIKGRAEYDRSGGQGGWLCFKKKDGCGATFGDNAPEIVGQKAGRVENPDIYDVRNTVLKMAMKRSLVSAALGLGCLAEMFTQDLDEDALADETHEAEAPPAPTKSQRPNGKHEAPPPEQSAPTKAPPQNGKAPAAASPKPAITNGKELSAYLDQCIPQYEAQGYLQAREVRDYLTAETIKAGLGDIQSWDAKAIAWAMPLLKRWFDDLKARGAKLIDSDEIDCVTEAMSDAQCDTLLQAARLARFALGKKERVEQLTFVEAGLIRNALMAPVTAK